MKHFWPGAFSLLTRETFELFNIQEVFSAVTSVVRVCECDSLVDSGQTAVIYCHHHSTPEILLSERAIFWPKNLKEKEKKYTLEADHDISLKKEKRNHTTTTTTKLAV